MADIHHLETISVYPLRSAEFEAVRRHRQLIQFLWIAIFISSVGAACSILAQLNPEANAYANRVIDVANQSLEPIRWAIETLY